MIDFISATIFGCKGTINFSHLQLENQSSKYNREIYAIKGCEDMKIVILNNTDGIRLKGSVPYFFQGNNFTFDRAKFVQTIDYIKQITNLDFWQADIDEFEYGVIMEVPTKPKEYIIHHSSKPNEGLTKEEKGRDKGRFRWWSDKNVSIKMYDAGYNIKTKQSESRKQTLRQIGWEDAKKYIKFEVHYKKPHIVLNKGRNMKLWHLANSDWEMVLKKDLLNQYQRLVPSKDIKLPNDKKDFRTLNVYAYALTESAINAGCSLEEVKKMLYNAVNSAGDILSKSDKDARKHEIKKIQSLIEVQTTSRWDLTEKIAQAVGLNSIPN
jgi:hypothetical protein